jgi:hypothetical protein
MVLDLQHQDPGAIVIGLNQIARLPKRSESLIERYWI